jgi:hypothetical protein
LRFLDLHFDLLGHAPADTYLNPVDFHEEGTPKKTIPEDPDPVGGMDPESAQPLTDIPTSLDVLHDTHVSALQFVKRCDHFIFPSLNSPQKRENYFFQSEQPLGRLSMNAPSA